MMTLNTRMEKAAIAHLIHFPKFHVISFPLRSWRDCHSKTNHPSYSTLPGISASIKAFLLPRQAGSVPWRYHRLRIADYGNMSYLTKKVFVGKRNLFDFSVSIRHNI